MKKIAVLLPLFLLLFAGTACAGYLWIGESEDEEYYLDNGKIFFVGNPIYTSATRQDVVDSWLKAVYKQPAEPQKPTQKLADAFINDSLAVECLLHIRVDLRTGRMALLEKMELNRWGELAQASTTTQPRPSASLPPSGTGTKTTAQQMDWITVRPGTLLKPIYEAVAAYVADNRDWIERNSLKAPRDFVAGR